MSEEKYYIIVQCDKEVYVNEYSKQKLLDLLKEENMKSDEFLSEIEYSNIDYWNGKHLIIKGKIVVPIEKQVVVEMDIE